RIYRRARADDRCDPHGLRAVDSGGFQRSAARPPDAASRPARPDSRHRPAAHRDSVGTAVGRAAARALRSPSTHPQFPDRGGALMRATKLLVRLTAYYLVIGLLVAVALNAWPASR